MTSYFRESRNIELSLLYYLENNLNTDWSGTTVIKTFKDAYSKNIELPIICVYLSDTSSTRLEIGDETLDNRYLLMIEVFAKSGAQRLDIADYIIDKLKDGWVHYDHSHVSGDNTSLDRTANGRDWVTSFVGNSKVSLIETIDTKDKHRHSISIRVRTSG